MKEEYMDTLLIKAPTTEKEKLENKKEVIYEADKSFIEKIQQKKNKRRQLFSNDWKFIYGEQTNAELNIYDDSTWRDVQLPHDYSLELPYSPAAEAESGYKLGGIGWYRKTFVIDEELANKRFVIEFGGVYMNSTVYINGHKLGDYPNGYTPFAYDLTDYIKIGEANVLAVRVNHKFPSSRWYSGSGIYRDVYLTMTDFVHVERYGVQILTPKLEEQLHDEVEMEVQTKVNNQSGTTQKISVRQQIVEKETKKILGSVQGETFDLKPKEARTAEISMQVAKPNLWSVENPYLYEVKTKILVDNLVVDSTVTDYGFRFFEFSAESGFYLNNKALKLKGVSMHSDQGSLGSAAHYRALERQVEILQKMGANAIRVTHNPAADELLEIANRKGMLIIDESFDTWIFNKNGNDNDYGTWFAELIGETSLLGAKAEMTWAEFDVKTMAQRGLNSPAIISWSVGNEVMEGSDGTYTEYPKILENLIQWVEEIDQTRPLTNGDNKFKEGWTESVEFGETLTKYNGLVGFNYANGEQFDQFHHKFPKWKIYGSESASAVNSRGVYKPEIYDRLLTSYDESTVAWGHLAADSWHSVITRDFVAGEFVWTGFDYLGEPTPWNNVGSGVTGEWPSPKSSYFGIVDTAGLPKDRYYFYQSQWNQKINTLHVLPIWKENRIELDEDGQVRIDVYSNASRVELFFENLAGEKKSLGRKTFTPYETEAGHSYQIYEGVDKKEENFRNLYLTWRVPYEKGTIYAVAYDSTGRKIENTDGRKELSNFGKASSLKLTADRTEIQADGRDLVYLTIDVLDKNGKLVEDAEELVHVRVEGAGELLALDNGHQVDHEPYDSGKRNTLGGKLVAIVKSTALDGELTIQAEAAGLETDRLSIQTVSKVKSEVAKKLIGYRLPTNYYVELGTEVELAAEIDLIFEEGLEETVAVSWAVEEGMFSTPDTVLVRGTVATYDFEVSTNVTVVESVGAVLNYSTAILTSAEGVHLPAKRPLVTRDGSILVVEFPVEWEVQDTSAYKQLGRVLIQGRADVFGEVFPVTASIRVTEPETVLSDNVAGTNLLSVIEDESENLNTSLEEIIDGDLGLTAIRQNKQPVLWTNEQEVQLGEKEAGIIFTYSTALYLGAVDLYFFTDEKSFSLPESVELYWSHKGGEDVEWLAVENIEETEEKLVMNEKGMSLTRRHYRFDGIPAVSFKIVPKPKETQEASLIGISQVELRVESQALKLYDVAHLGNVFSEGQKITLNNQAENEFTFNQGLDLEIKVENKENRALTTLKPTENNLRIISEAEDCSTQEVITFRLK